VDALIPASSAITRSGLPRESRIRCSRKPIVRASSLDGSIKQQLCSAGVRNRHRRIGSRRRRPVRLDAVTEGTVVGKDGDKDENKNKDGPGRHDSEREGHVHEDTAKRIDPTKYGTPPDDDD
jgi:hypothetical protein